MRKESMTRREFLSSAGLAAGAAGLSAVGPPARPAGAQAPAKVQREVTLKHWMHIDPPNPVYAQLVNEFNAKHRGQIKVELQVIPWNAYHQQLTTAIAAGNAPDTARLVEFWIGQFWAGRWVLPLDGYIEKWEGRQNFPPAAFDARRSGPGQPVVLMPCFGWSSLLYYRRDWFEREGLKPPATHDEFLSACKAIASPKENRWAYALRGARGGQQHWEAFIFQAGGEYVNDKGEIVIDSPDAIRAAAMQAELLTRHKVVWPDAVTDDWPQLVKGVQTGQIAMMNHGIHIRKLLTEALGDKIAPAVLPRDKREGTFKSASGPAILSQTRSPDEAWEWVKFWSSAEAAEMFIENKVEDMMPENTRVAGHRKFKEDEYYQIAARMAQVPTYTPFWHPRYGPMVEKIWSPTMQKVLLGELTPEQQMKAYADFMRKPG